MDDLEKDEQELETDFNPSKLPKDDEEDEFADVEDTEEIEEVPEGEVEDVEEESLDALAEEEDLADEDIHDDIDPL